MPYSYYKAVYVIVLIVLCWLYDYLVVSENEPVTDNSHSDDDDSDDSSSIPTIVLGIIAGIAIITLIVIGVILIAFCLRYICSYNLLYACLFQIHY